MKKLLYLSVVALIYILFGIFYYWNPILLDQQDPIIEIGTQFDPYENVLNIVYGDIKDLKIKGKVDTNTPGVYSLTYQYKDRKKTIKVKVIDSKAPILEVKNVKTDLQEHITPELFVKNIKDSSKVTLSFENVPELKKKGKQKLNILAKDIYGNSTTKKVILERLEDKTPPEIKNKKAIQVLQGSMEDFASKIRVKDDLDANPQLELDTSQVDTFSPGIYSIHVKATDRSNNIVDQDVKVEVKENPEYNKKIVYLTFDDGPSENTIKVLDILKEYDVKATFFVTGHAPSYNDFIKEAFEQGHSIGLHTYSHDYKNIYSSTNAYFNDLDQINSMVESITGQKSDIIRFPGGSSNSISAKYSPGIMSELVKMVNEKGYQYFDWNVSSSDAAGNDISKEQIIQSSCTDKFDQINLLFHDSATKNSTVEALPDIIKFYKDRGYKFYPLTKKSYVVHHQTTN
ncbi:polysaccharide deacetylase family protein [Faecalitalea cylindroides]|uniref:polysaccharide deacetylase family protein n=1 Tax=Faecalitalea cylindroides TaxID=39483 RepID=UPI0022E65E46|nr:polysaccharide deacetylase family protein [Faecalitalea cylindroides]